MAEPARDVRAGDRIRAANNRVADHIPAADDYLAGRSRAADRIPVADRSPVAAHSPAVDRALAAGGTPAAEQQADRTRARARPVAHQAEPVRIRTVVVSRPRTPSLQ
ncbi:hypothetical protein GCM10023319_57670 [Nocardia iowensis]